MHQRLVGAISELLQALPACRRFSMDNARKKELARTYKERKRLQGIFAVRCDASGEVWIGKTRNLDTEQNKIWFVLRHGSHTNASLQSAWNARGEAAFRYEIVEEVTDENLLLIESLIKDREKHWRSELGAEAVTG
jgi:hypothetical protein